MCRVLVVLVLSACAVEPTPAPPPPDHGLLGTWRYVPLRADVAIDQRQVLVFGADGRYSMNDPRSAEVGTFAIEDNDVTISASTGGSIRSGYAVTPDRLIVDAMFPTGETDGLVGTWIGAQSTADATSVIELELRADGTGHLVQTGSATDEVDATWIRDDPYAVITFVGVSRPKSLPALPGIAIGEWLYERVP